MLKESKSTRHERVCRARQRALSRAPLNLVATGLLAVGMLSSCSLSTYDRKPCETNAECQGVFGLGHVCAENGYCEAVALSPRCTHTFPENLLSDPSLAADRVVIGTVFETNVPRHLARERAAQVALKITSEEGGAENHTFGGIFCTTEENYAPLGGAGDGLSRTEATVALSRHLIDAYGVPAIVGPSLSSDVTALFSALDLGDGEGQDNVLLMSPAATAVSITALEPDATDLKPGLMWRTAAPDLEAPLAIGQDLASRGVQSIAIVNRTGPYGDGFADGVIGGFGQLPGTSFVRFTFSSDSDRLAALDMAAEAAGEYEELLYFAGSDGDTEFMISRAVDDSRFDGKTLVLADVAAVESQLDGANADVLSRIRGVRPKPPSDSDPVFSAYLAAFANEYPQPGDADARIPFAANTFDGTWMIAGGIAWALSQEQGVVSGVTIARGLRKMSSGSSTTTPLRRSGWSQLTNAFRSGESINIQGASGLLDYDLVTEEREGVVEIWLACRDANNVTIEPELALDVCLP